MIPILIITGCQAAYLHPSLWCAVLDPLRASVRSNQLLATRPLGAPVSSRWNHADICLKEKKRAVFQQKTLHERPNENWKQSLAKILKPLVKLSLLFFSWLVFQDIFFLATITDIPGSISHQWAFFELPTQRSSLPSTFFAMLPSKHAAQATLQSWHASNPEPSRWFPKFWWENVETKMNPKTWSSMNF